MTVLLDTHTLLWWLWGSARLGKQAKALILADSTEIWVSAASLWETSIKTSLGRLDRLPSFEKEMRVEMERSGFRPLPITFDHALAVRELPPHHRDPFDRLLIAQALCENLTLVTADPAIAAYDVRTIDASR